MWPFILTKTFSTSREAAVSQRHALDFLHDIPAFISLSPLLESYALEKGGNPCTYTIVDRLKVLGSFSTTTTLRATFTTCDDGLDVEVNAGAWTRLRTEYRVRPAVQGRELGVLVIEHVTIYVCLLLPPSRRANSFSNHRASSALCPLSTPR
ncbi:uncharacterized protein EV420DRAFT_940136 [Desarmillaria tabescens]|uniref:DUF7053 domain-containing protein n=1 Tax=Armillaria tabescens TaxID=1929756 RepID=A0AA39TNI3_ARMTA|nr:uncharacterized protein EV420DRAFT_940136 [Desarmillaria tabescens]KAK0465117.1 hypothetical protein EV420DRAFT_940136 [Desarmillaria tabescens]